MEDKGIFEGLKVIDCASFIAAPAAATVLSDFGADVIKIEPPSAGDPYRNLPNLPGYPHSEHNFAWLLVGRNAGNPSAVEGVDGRESKPIQGRATSRGKCGLAGLHCFRSQAE